MSVVARMAMLDLRSVASFRLQLLLLIAVAALVGLANDDPASIVPTMTVYAALVSSYPFAVAEKDDLDTLYGVLPLTRRAVLAGHYVAAVTVCLATCAVGTALAVVLGAVRSVPVVAGEFAVLLALSWTVFGLVVAVQFPLFVRIGYGRARFVGNLPFVVVFALIVLIAPRLGLHPSDLPDRGWFVVLVTAAAAGLLAVSCLVSVRIDPRRIT